LAIKMLVPNALKFDEGLSMTKEDSMRIIRPPSYIASKNIDVEAGAGESKKLDWKERLAEWRTA
jgi:hypothetical protein